MKILDLGISKKKETYFFEKKCGTLIYMAPEQVTDKQYTKSVDIWSAGFILYIICSGGIHPTFNKAQLTENYVQYIQSLKSWKFPFNFPSLAKNLFLKMCDFKFNSRLYPKKIINHPFISRNKKDPFPLTHAESFNVYEQKRLLRRVNF